MSLMPIFIIIFLICWMIILVWGVSETAIHTRRIADALEEIRDQPIFNSGRPIPDVVLKNYPGPSGEVEVPPGFYDGYKRAYGEDMIGGND